MPDSSLVLDIGGVTLGVTLASAAWAGPLAARYEGFLAARDPALACDRGARSGPGP